MRIKTCITAAGLALLAACSNHPAANFATRLRADHPRGTALFIGHSNTLPALARALCDCPVADIDERVYGIRYTVRQDASGHAVLAETRD